MTFVRGFRDGMQKLGSNVNAAVNTVLLLIVYVIGIGPVSIIARMFGRSFLSMRPRRSTWVRRQKPAQESLQRMF